MNKEKFIRIKNKIKENAPAISAAIAAAAVGIAISIYRENQHLIEVVEDSKFRVKRDRTMEKAWNCMMDTGETQRIMSNQTGKPMFDMVYVEED